MAHPYLPTIFRKWPDAATVSDLAIEMTSCRVKVVIFKPLGSKSSLKCIFWLLAHLVCHQDHFRFNNSFIFTTNILTSRKCSRIVYSRIKGLPPYFIKIHQITKNKQNRKEMNPLRHTRTIFKPNFKIITRIFQNKAAKVSI